MSDQIQNWEYRWALRHCSLPFRPGVENCSARNSRLGCPGMCSSASNSVLHKKRSLLGMQWINHLWDISNQNPEYIGQNIVFKFAWKNIVEEYSKYNLTLSLDKLVAISATLAISLLRVASTTLQERGETI
jgi:hypothetical protein